MIFQPKTVLAGCFWLNQTSGAIHRIDLGQAMDPRGPKESQPMQLAWPAMFVAPAHGVAVGRLAAAGHPKNGRQWIIVISRVWICRNRGYSF